MSLLYNQGVAVGGVNVVNDLTQDPTAFSTKALSAELGKSLNDNKADRTEIASSSDEWESPHSGGYKYGEICIVDNVVYRCIKTQAENSEVNPTSSSGSTYWEESSLADALKTYPVTLTNATYVSGGCVCGVVSLSALYGGITASSGNWKGLGMLNFKPDVSEVYTVGIKTANGHFAGMVKLDSNGYMQLYAAEAFSNNALAFTISFRADDTV